MRTLWSGLIDGCVQIWFLPLPFCGVTLVLLLVGLVGLMRNSVKLDFPIFCRSGQREASLEELNEEVVGWLPLLPEIDCLP